MGVVGQSKFCPCKPASIEENQYHRNQWRSNDNAADHKLGGWRLKSRLPTILNAAGAVGTLKSKRPYPHIYGPLLYHPSPDGFMHTF